MRVKNTLKKKIINIKEFDESQNISLVNSIVH